MSNLKKVLKDFGFSDSFLEKISCKYNAFEIELPDTDYTSQYSESENIILNSDTFLSSDTVRLSAYNKSLQRTANRRR